MKIETFAERIEKPISLFSQTKSACGDFIDEFLASDGKTMIIELSDREEAYVLERSIWSLMRYYKINVECWRKDKTVYVVKTNAKGL